MESSDGNEGRRVARLFRKYRLAGHDRICDLDRIVAEDGIEVAEASLANPGYTACLLRPVPDAPGGILLAPGQIRGRRRFSVAHELGHYHIPKHNNRTRGWCGEDDMNADRESGEQMEWEANDFAAELLMPRQLFHHDAAQCEPSFRNVIDLASEDRYDVSITAAAIRYVQVTREHCALVSATRGVINWVAKSDHFVYRIPWKGDSVPPASAAAAVFRGEEPSEQLQSIDPYVWLELEQRREVEVFESTFSIPSQSQVLSLVWVVPEDSFDDESLED